MEQSVWKQEMSSICKKAKDAYRPPLCIKKQRVEARPESNGPVKEYSDEEILLYLMRKFSKEQK